MSLKLRYALHSSVRNATDTVSRNSRNSAPAVTLPWLNASRPTLHPAGRALPTPSSPGLFKATCRAPSWASPTFIIATIEAPMLQRVQIMYSTQYGRQHLATLPSLSGRSHTPSTSPVLLLRSQALPHGESLSRHTTTASTQLVSMAGLQALTITPL